MKFCLQHADALSALSRMGSQSVDTLLTDPPYSSSSTDTRSGNRSARNKYVSSDAQHALPDFPGENRDQRGYTRWLAEILTEAYRTSRDQGTAVLFTDWRNLPATTDALQMAGWYWSGIVPWIKPISRPRRGGYRQSAEFIIWGVKGRLAQRAVYLIGHFAGSQPRKERRHITQKPLQLMRELVRICPEGGTVLDPFTGSGTTGEAALLEERNFLGTEASRHYFQVAKKRLEVVPGGHRHQANLLPATRLHGPGR